MAGRTPALIDFATPAVSTNQIFRVVNYDLSATLNSGQAFRWKLHQGHWIGVIGNRWVALSHSLPLSSSSSKPSFKIQIGEEKIVAQTAEPVDDWRWLTDYLQLDLDLSAILATFPDDEPMRCAIAACPGLRLLRQDPWECLASFILSSTKQIVQIQQIIALLCERFGEPVIGPPDFPGMCAFPSPPKIASLSEVQLRGCKMGFRAPNLRATARLVDEGKLDLARLATMPVGEAREQLMQLPGVGRKIADCVLLFAYGFQSAFPVDVWVLKALREMYFPRRRPKLKQLHHFSETHFGPNAGYAQQYLFHYRRTKKKYPAAK